MNKKESKKQKKPQDKSKSSNKKLKKTKKQILKLIKPVLTVFLLTQAKPKKKKKRKSLLKKIFKKKHKKQFEKILKEITIVVIVVILVFLGFKIWDVYAYPKGNLEVLPADTTVFAYEWITNKENEHFKKLSKQLGESKVQTIIELEKLYLPQNVHQAVQNINPTQKTIAGINYNNKLQLVFLFNISEEDKYRFIREASKPSFGWNYRFNKDLLFLSKNEAVLSYLVTNPKPISRLERFRDAFYNVPQHNFIDFYINHELLELSNPNNIDDPISQYGKKLFNLFGVTYGVVRVSDEGAYISTYTNPVNDRTVRFPSVTDKYQADLANFIPSDPKLFIGGQDLQTRIFGFIKNLTNLNSDQTETYIKSILANYNLSEKAFVDLTKMLANEYAIATYEEGAIFIFENIGRNEEIILQLQRLQSFFNPVIESYKLKDGTTARRLVPNEQVIYKTIDSKTYAFELKEIGETLYYYFNDDANYLTTSEDLLNKVKDVKVSYGDTDKVMKLFETVMPISDEIAQFNPNDFLQTPSELAPLVTSAANYFDDGIQTVHYLIWPKN